MRACFESLLPTAAPKYIAHLQEKGETRINVGNWQFVWKRLFTDIARCDEKEESSMSWELNCGSTGLFTHQQMCQEWLLRSSSAGKNWRTLVDSKLSLCPHCILADVTVDSTLGCMHLHTTSSFHPPSRGQTWRNRSGLRGGGAGNRSTCPVRNWAGSAWRKWCLWGHLIVLLSTSAYKGSRRRWSWALQRDAWGEDKKWQWAKLQQERFNQHIGRGFLPWAQQSADQVAPKICAVPIPGGFQEPCRHRPEQPGLATELALLWAGVWSRDLQGSTWIILWLKDQWIIPKFHLQQYEVILIKVILEWKAPECKRKTNLSFWNYICKFQFELNILLSNK